MRKMTIQDSDDNVVEYLITFKDEADMNEINEIAQKVKDEIEDYTYEDLLEKINERFPIAEVETLETYDRLHF